MESALESQERLAGEEALIIKAQYERCLQIVDLLATLMADYDSVDPGRQRIRFDQLLSSTIESEEQLVAIYAVCYPNTIDAGWDETFAGTLGNTQDGQYASWYTRQWGTLEHLTYNDAETVIAISNGPRAREDIIYNPEPASVAGRDTLTFKISAPIIHRASGQVLGRVGVIVDADFIQTVLIDALAANDEVEAMVVFSDNGTIVASGVPEQVGSFIDAATAPLFANNLKAAQDAVANGEKVRFSLHSLVLDMDLETILYPFPIGETGVNWTLMLGIETDVINAGINRMILFTLVIAAACVVISILIIIAAAGRISKPVVDMAAILEEVSQGDFTKTLSIKSRDEIGGLADSVNTTITNIKGLIRTIKDQSTVLFNIGSELAGNMSETAAAINEITANIQSINTRVMAQSASVTETNSTMDQIAVNIGKLSVHIDKQTGDVSQSSSSIEEMIANIHSVIQTLSKNSEYIKELIKASEVGRSGLQEVSTDIQEIARESAGLLEINEVMQNIAGQTNLLSMNAAIEAAHAGDVGKGFAVVADEIRKLAEDSGEQSKTISDVLSKIKDSIDKIDKSTANVISKFEAIERGVRTVSEHGELIQSAMEEQGSGSKQILEAIGHLNETTRLVKDGSEEMLTGSKQVIKESRNVEMSTHEIAEGMNEMATGTNQINEAVNRVNEITISNKENIEVLVQEVSKFKIE
jgi:methyl-accepting chemotaxis protein